MQALAVRKRYARQTKAGTPNRCEAAKASPTEQGKRDSRRSITSESNFGSETDGLSLPPAPASTRSKGSGRITSSPKGKDRPCTLTSQSRSSMTPAPEATGERTC
eukprot:Skav234255  [mRNA]  locus=scaffold1464:692539:695652:- [translate_table: standard]